MKKKQKPPDAKKPPMFMVNGEPFARCVEADGERYTQMVKGAGARLLSENDQARFERWLRAASLWQSYTDTVDGEIAVRFEWPPKSE